MRNRPNLFEVISKAPQTQQTGKTRKLPLLSGLRRNTAKSQPLVAQALTEEEAAAELANRRAAVEAEARIKAEAREKVQRDKEAKKQARLERKAAKAAIKQAQRLKSAELAVLRAAERAAKRQAMVPMPEGKPVLRAGQGRVAFSVSTAGFMVAAGVVCAVLFGVYRLGFRSGSDTEPDQLAKSTQNDQAESTALASLTAQSARRPASDRKNRSAAEKGNELDDLLRPPASVVKNVMANQPVRVDQPPGSEAPPKSKLNYVQIDCFLITVQRTGEDLRADLEDVRNYLKKNGVETFARETSTGFFLYSAAGFRMSRDARAERDAFLKKIEKLGQDYFRGGGRYQFKGCFFVSYNNAMRGQAVSFKE